MDNTKIKCLHFTSEILRNPTRSTWLWGKGPLLWLCWFLEVKVKLSQLCPNLWDPMDYTVHGILQARILEWVAFPFSRGSSQPRDRTQVSHIAGRFFTSWATREALLENPQLILCKWFPTELAFPGKDWVIWMDSMGWEMEERRISTGSSYLWDVPDTAAQQLTKPSRLNQALSRVNEWDWLFRFYRNQG